MTDVTVPRAEDFDEISALLALAFHDDPDPEMTEVERGVFEPERALLVRDGGTAVAHAAAFTRDLQAPGASVPAAHVTMVSVLPTHRRRGLLTALMRRQLREIRDAGREPVAVLWASEGRIYPRFGYGLAAQRYTLQCETAELRLPEPASAGGTLRLDRPAGHRAELARVYERVRADRPGWSSRDERWWAYVLADVKGHRDGATERRVLLHDGTDGVDGYALYRTKEGWEPRGPRGEVRVDEVVAATPEAYLALWRLLLSLDLTRRLSFRTAAVDEPLLWLLNEPRGLGAQLADALWVRVVDVPTALAARRYATDVDLVIEVTDELLPENSGRWRLVGGPAGAECVATTAPAHLACDVRALGELYLGGAGLGALAAAGRVRELIPGTVATSAAPFTWHRAPSPMEVF
ncbi:MULTISPECIES: GNAT family N-acetyltransferase [Micromonospora]|uniref:GNAT family N-acetyltransferase n=1 Tax=Micromonospora solifontis TaxID=2487138 RepID=A0ABX9WB92_9ACTN|nr:MULTISPECIES: GNAT family N-acetyltransferase [Micromonospora]NES16034.1 GNAT family N-acetyltransferase [Micromonospora sp. PPF5-17B]NES38698.1 GNAT family N-acetyltransferase [Micromonospora solifontis]NES57386.1 GNAT family N-acetyltransferase [Micromonospora sp. PPF5-6]RNL94001.1 GNAT family N-acetyltransferase [Micromonospora solifontis]